MTHHILIYYGRIFLCMQEHMRARTYDTHITFQHIEELRELVDVGLAHKIAERKLARIILCGLNLIGISVDVHRSEFVAHEWLAIKSSASLHEEDTSRALLLDDNSHNRQERKQAYQRYQAHYYIKYTLDKPPEAVRDSL